MWLTLFLSIFVSVAFSATDIFFETPLWRSLSVRPAVPEGLLAVTTRVNSLFTAPQFNASAVSLLWHQCVQLTVDKNDDVLTLLRAGLLLRAKMADLPAASESLTLIDSWLSLCMLLTRSGRNEGERPGLREKSFLKKSFVTASLGVCAALVAAALWGYKRGFFGWRSSEVRRRRPGGGRGYAANAGESGGADSGDESLMQSAAGAQPCPAGRAWYPLLSEASILRLRVRHGMVVHEKTPSSMCIDTPSKRLDELIAREASYAAMDSADAMRARRVEERVDELRAQRALPDGEAAACINSRVCQLMQDDALADDFVSHMIFAAGFGRLPRMLRHLIVPADEQDTVFVAEVVQACQVYVSSLALAVCGQSSPPILGVLGAPSSVKAVQDFVAFCLARQASLEDIFAIANDPSVRAILTQKIVKQTLVAIQRSSQVDEAEAKCIFVAHLAKTPACKTALIKEYTRQTGGRLAPLGPSQNGTNDAAGGAHSTIHL